VRVEVTPEVLEESAGKAAAVVLADQIKALIVVSADVEVTVPGGIERSAGKAKRIVDFRKK
jgi:phenylacetate-CoA ligase